MAFECASPWYKSTCNLCKCVERGSPCSICIFFRFKCRGTCPCCEDHRKTLPSTSQGLEPSSAPKEDAERICDQCNCLKNRKSCRKCVRGSYKCTGTCLCCISSQKTRITVGGKDLDDLKIIGSLETFNTTSGASTQTDSPPQKKHIRKPPSRPACILTIKKNRRILCLQCFCEADKVPCEICCYKEARCHGTCPCCKIKSIYRFLNPRDSDMFEPICPRCTRTPGEGVCDHCRKVADESADALARFRTKRGRRPKPAILAHKKKEAKGDDVKGDEAKDVEPPTESKEKEEPALVFVPNDLHLLDQSYVKDEYCLNCQCRRGQEPCDTCIDSPCYGECECEECVEFNRQLLNDPIENLPENHENKEEQVKTPKMEAVIKKKSSTSTKGRLKLVKTVDREASTSQTTEDRLYSESLKCEQCDCVKYCRPCEDCSDMDMGCTFPVDDKLCLCCSIRFVF